MYKSEICTGARMFDLGTSKPPFGVTFDEKELESADKMEVWHTSFSDAEEYTEFRLMNGENVVAIKRVNGY